jgi:hypothetical protein
MHLPQRARLLVLLCARRTSLVSNCNESAISTGIPNVDERITPSGLIGQTSCPRLFETMRGNDQTSPIRFSDRKEHDKLAQ